MPVPVPVKAHQASAACAVRKTDSPDNHQGLSGLISFAVAAAAPTWRSVLPDTALWLRHARMRRSARGLVLDLGKGLTDFIVVNLQMLQSHEGSGIADTAVAAQLKGLLGRNLEDAYVLFFAVQTAMA